MGIPILIVTRTLAFGELAQQHLMFQGLYSPVQTNNGQAALELARITSFEAAILDNDLSDISQEDLAIQLRKILPRIRLIVVPPHNDSEQIQWNTIFPDDFLTKPFYYLDLLTIVETAIKKGAQSETIIALKPADVLKKPVDDRTNVPDPSDLVSEPSDQSEMIWKADYEQAASTLHRLLQGKTSQAGLIFQNKVLVAYAGELEPRAARQLAELVAKTWEKIGSSDMARFVQLGGETGEIMLYASPIRSDWVLVLVFSPETPFGKMRSEAAVVARALTAHSAGYPHHFEDGIDLSEAERETLAESDLNTAANFSVLFGEIPPPAAPDPASTAPINASAAYDPEGKTETPVSETSSLPASYTAREVYHQNYACLLIPFASGHQITDSLADDLSRWVPQLCQVFGWKLLHLSVQPDYLHWVVDVPPATSPARIVQLLRQHTSSRIFPGFPHLFHDNPSGDFWSSAYLITSSNQPMPAGLLQKFIQQTRRQMIE
jgi:putative transposase